MDNASPEFSRSAFGLTKLACGSRIFAHELGHNMGLVHDRFQECDGFTCGVGPAYPYGYGYVNQRAFEAGAPESARWRTIMSYANQCDSAPFHCEQLLRFSNAEQNYRGDPMGVPGDVASSSVTGPSDAARALNNARGIVAHFRSDADLGFPDLVASLSAVDDATTTTPGRAVTLSATVLNHGTTTAPATSLDIRRRDPDADGDFSWTDLASIAVDSLAAGGRSSRQLEVIAPSSQGTHFYVAFAGAVDGERNINNNDSLWLNVPVVVPACMTDLGTAPRFVTRTGAWDGSCPSAYYLHAGKYARYYRFTLTAPTPVVIDLTSTSADPLLALRNNTGLVAEDDDGGTKTSARIRRTLQAGTYTIEATTYAGGETGPFSLMLRAAGSGFTDDPIRPGVTPVKAVHFTELRARIDGLRATHRLNPFQWTDPVPEVGAPVKTVHVTQLRAALLETYSAAGRTPDFPTGPVQAGEPIRARHINQLRRAVEALR